MTDQQDPSKSWMLFQGKGDGVQRPVNQRPEAPPWRRFQKDAKKDERGNEFIAPPGLPEMVNAALYLRRPLLLTGKPGTGKSSVAYAVAYELGLGKVLRWPITSRSTLLEGLYRYDAIGPSIHRLLEHLAGSDSAGCRLAAVMILQERPDSRYINWLAKRVEVERAFIGFHAAQALLSCATHLDTAFYDQIRRALAYAKSSLDADDPETTGRFEVLEEAEGELDRKWIEMHAARKFLVDLQSELQFALQSALQFGDLEQRA